MMALCLGLALVLGACATGPAELPEPGPVEPAPDQAPATWGYTGDIGPAVWGQLDPAYSQCELGQMQSPVDVPAAEPVAEPAITYEAVPSPLDVVNNGHTIQVDFAPGSTLRVGGDTYALLQMHHHAPSEHTVQGKAYPLELHLVHQGAEGQLAVLGVFFEEGTPHPALDPILEAAPTEVGRAEAPGTLVDPAAFLPASKASWRYWGSLTTPPCSENVRWFVMAETMTASAEQLAAFRALYDENARPVQALHGRTVDTHAR